jgi:hypothetical protein
MACPLCALHCPYCGAQDLAIAVDEELMACRACGHSEDLPHPELIHLEDRLAREISGHSIQDWKAKAQQLDPIFHHRWRSTMLYLDPASSAAISHAHGLMIGGMPEDEAIARAKQARVALQRVIDADPALATAPRPGDIPFLDDWF